MRPLSNAVISQSQSLAAQNTTPVALLPQLRAFQTTSMNRDIDSAAKFVGAGAATVGCAGSGMCTHQFSECLRRSRALSHNGLRRVLMSHDTNKQKHIHTNTQPKLLLAWITEETQRCKPVMS